MRWLGSSIVVVTALPVDALSPTLLGGYAYVGTTGGLYAVDIGVE